MEQLMLMQEDYNSVWHAKPSTDAFLSDICQITQLNPKKNDPTFSSFIFFYCSC